jgi:penicillin-binding protein 1C
MFTRSQRSVWRALCTATLLTVAILMGLGFIVRVWPKPPLGSTIPMSTAISARDGELLRLTLAADGQYRLWVRLEQMPARLPGAVILYEDQWFYRHPGVNPVALLRAALNNWGGGRRVGASTITMQLARRMYAINTRSPLGKLRQIACALWLEARYSKHDILEAYLNLAPYGRNVEGAGAASLVFFGRRVSELSVPQSMTLAVVPQNPRMRRLFATTQSPAADEQSRGTALDDARRRLWTRWLKAHPADARFSGDIAVPVDATSPEPLPFLAPHFTDAIIAGHYALVPRRYTPLPTGSARIVPRNLCYAQALDSLSWPPVQRMQCARPIADDRAYDFGVSGDVRTTLDLPRQKTVERVLRNTVDEQSAIGIRNAGALLLEVDRNGAAQIRAYVGSADYHNAQIDGQINAVTAKRSPGSTLKPFVYALALDQGLLHPRSILKDTPTSFGPFSPENFDGRFVGPIAAEDALIRSRNVPAVAIASQLSHPNLYDFLRASGVSHLNSERYYGLALTLGGGEVSMEELGRMYAIFLNGGRVPTLQYLIEPTASAPPASSGEQLLSDEASFITLDMLEKNPRPDTGQPAAPAVAWKTGTSWGFHDAWSVAVFGRYVLIVWIGNFDNTSNPAFVGVQAAAPLLFRIIDALRSQGLDSDDLPRPKPRNLARVDVCAASGDLPNADCPQTVSTWYIPGKSPIRISELHRRIYIDAAGHRVCGPGPGIRQEIYEFWTSDMLRLFREAGMPRRVPPATPDCGAAAADSSGDDRDAPQIVSPLRGVVYTLRIGHLEPLALRATIAARAQAIYWFADNAYLGRAPHGESLAWLPPQPGHYRLRAVDDGGAADTREVDVEVVP